MVHLATGNNDKQPQTVGQIASETLVPAGYLAKVLQSLSRSGLIVSRRGLGGGFQLAKPAGDISIFEVIQAVDVFQRIHSCPLKLEAHRTKLCPLHKRLDDAMALIEAQFKATTIDELLSDTDSDQKLRFIEGCQSIQCP